MSHWPDLERCKALVRAGFPQDNSHFVWALTKIRSEDPKHRHNEWILITRSRAIVEEIEGYPYYQLIAAPIATELWRELPFQTYLKKMDDGSTMGWLHDSEFILDINPANVLADLWLWLREKGEKG